MHKAIGRPLQFDPDEALEAAMQLFWSKGYEATSMQELVTAMNISKSSLYQAFGGKEPLFRQCVARYADHFTARLNGGLAAAPSGRAFIETFLNSVIEDVKQEPTPRGCLVMNTASEFTQRNPVIAEDIATSIGRFRSVLLAAIKRAQREGDIDQASDASMLANYLVSSMSGLKTLAKAGVAPRTLKGIIKVTLKAVI